MSRPNSLPPDFEQTLTQQGYDPTLVHALVEVYNKVLLDETIRNGKSHGKSYGQQLHDTMCQFATNYSFTPNDNTLSLTTNQPFADGQYGTVYRASFNQKNMLTKTTKTFCIDMIREVFVNIVMINSFLLSDQLIGNLVPTFGMYVTEQYSNTGKELHINMVQQFIEAPTLYDLIIKNGITLSNLKKVIGQLFSILTILHESPYHIRHNDVHTKNVMVTTTNQAYLIDFGLSTFTYGKFYDLREDNTLENHYYHYEDYRHIGALDMFHIFYTIHQNANSAPTCEPIETNHQLLDSTIREQIINYSKSMLQKLVYDRFWDTDPCSTIVKHIDINDNIRILGYDDEPIHDINWFYYLMDGLDKKAFTHGGFGLRATVHTKNVALLKEMTYRWFLSTYCTENEYDIKWNIIENTIQNVKHIISNIEPIEPIQCTPQNNIKKGRNPSHRKKNPKERQFKLSHHKQYKQRKNRVAKC
jgi:hypothetical protein